MQRIIHFKSILLNTDVYLGNIAESLTKLSNRNCILLCDENLESKQNSFVQQFTSIVIPAGETSKSIETISYILTELMILKADRNTLLIGFGGGVITDVAGFVASIYKRGIAVAFIPTSLLGMTDAAIGGKNGINFNNYKNQIGTIRQPEFTWIDPVFLKTLSNEHFLNGLAELLKTSILFSENNLKVFLEHKDKILNADNGTLMDLLSETAQNKLQIVESDEHDLGIRQLLNFGHTFGHAIEAQDKVLHGFAVSLGMVASIKLSEAKGYISSDNAMQIIDLIKDIGLPTKFKFKKEYFLFLEQDKKLRSGKISFIFIKELGDAFIEEISLQEIKELAYDARD
jgi:3-dehydroquinate synthase